MLEQGLTHPVVRRGLDSLERYVPQIPALTEATVKHFRNQRDYETVRKELERDALMMQWQAPYVQAVEIARKAAASKSQEYDVEWSPAQRAAHQADLSALESQLKSRQTELREVSARAAEFKDMSKDVVGRSETLQLLLRALSYGWVVLTVLVTVLYYTVAYAMSWSKASRRDLQRLTVALEDTMKRKENASSQSLEQLRADVSRLSAQLEALAVRTPLAGAPPLPASSATVPHAAGMPTTCDAAIQTDSRRTTSPLWLWWGPVALRMKLLPDGGALMPNE